MAKSTTNTAANGPDAGQPNFAVALLIVTLIAGAAGSGFAFTFMKSTGAEAVATKQGPVESHTPAEVDKAVTNRFPADAVEVPLAPIVTGLGPKAERKMRLEASVIMTKDAAKSTTLKAEMVEDIVAFLNSVTAEEISGPRGLQNLREDLDDRAKIRGRGTVLGLLISGFVLE